MAIRLVVKQRSEEGGAEKGAEVLLDQESVVLGRDPACQVVLAQKAVSRNHARISRDGSLFFIEDLGSAYGTEVNGQALPKGEKRLLRNGDVIAIAQFDVLFDRVPDLPTGGAPGATQMVARQMVKDVMRGLASATADPYFRVMNGPREGQKLEIQPAQELIVGRDETADVMLKDDLVSRRHCKIRRDWSGTHVEDLGSRNGIKVNRRRVTRKTLRDRDELEIGGIRLLYLDPAEVRDSPLPRAPEDEGEKTTDGPLEQPKAAEEPQPEPAPEPEEEPSAEGEEPPAAEEPAPDPEPELLAEEAPPEPDEPEAPAPAGGFRAVLSGRQAIPIVAMGVFALLALAVVIAVLVGA